MENVDPRFVLLAVGFSLIPIWLFFLMVRRLLRFWNERKERKLCEKNAEAWDSDAAELFNENHRNNRF